MSKKERWRTRVRGTGRQIGQKFKLQARESKDKLSRELQTVVPKEVREAEREEISQDDIEALASELEYALLTNDLKKIVEIEAQIQELESKLGAIDSPQGVRREKYQRALEEIAEELEKKKPEPETVPSDLVPVGRTKSGKIIYERRK